MTSAQLLIWETAGRPEVEGAKGKLLKPYPDMCSITGEQEELTADARRALGENFTDQSLWQAHTGRVGQPALWCCSGKGRLSPRMWSWVCAPGEDLPDSVDKAPIHVPGLCQTNRGNTRPVIDILLNPPSGEWVVCIAVSGQKHVLPYAVTNRGSGEWSVRMEDTTITATPTQWKTVFGLCLALRRLGVPADDITAGRPAYITTRDDLDRWRLLASLLDPYRTSPLVQLALWCITKPILEDTNDYPNP